jgi:hypothetical protein
VSIIEKKLMTTTIETNLKEILSKFKQELVRVDFSGLGNCFRLLFDRTIKQTPLSIAPVRNLWYIISINLN